MDGAFLCGGLILASVDLSGCAGARHVQVDKDGGVVAIPSNTNAWPTYYRDKAEALIRQKCPNGYVIEREEEAVTGTVMHTNGQTRTRETPSLLLGGTEEQTVKRGNRERTSASIGALAIPLGDVEQHSEQTTTAQNLSEWRIVYRTK